MSYQGTIPDATNSSVNTTSFDNTTSFGNITSNAQNTVSDAFSNAQNTLSETFSNAQNTLSGTTDSISNNLNSFSSRSYLSGDNNFLESNGLVAKFAFILLVVIVFILLLRVSIGIINYFASPKENPILIDGMIDAKKMMSFPQDPNLGHSVPIMRSKNQRGGVEFTWSVWLFIDDLTYGFGHYKHVFHKGNPKIQENGMNFPNNGPGLYLAPNDNKLVAVMNTFDVIQEEVEVTNLPLNKWFNVILRVDEQNKFDVYINGKLVKRMILTGVPKQNYEDVYVAMNGGFSGNISSLRYYSKALGTFEIQQLIKQGPSLKIQGNNMSSSSKIHSNYLSLDWFFNN